MLGRTKALLALAASLTAASPALAVPVAAPTPPEDRALLLIPLTLTKVQDIHFGTIVPSTTDPGTVTIDPVTGARSGSPEVTLMASDPGQRGEFAGAGSVGQQVIMALTPPATLSNGLGDTLVVQNLVLDGPAVRTIGAGNAFFVGVGGTIEIPANQAEGLYSATYDLTADYQ